MKKLIIILSLFISAHALATGKWTVSRIDKDYSPKNDITGLSFDKQGALWASTSCGVFAYANGSWEEKGLRKAYLHTIYVDDNNTKWAGLYLGGLHFSTDGNKWEKVNQPEMSGSVNAVTSDKKGTIWMGDWNEGLFSLTPGAKGKWAQYRSGKQLLGDNAIFSVTTDSKNQLWAGTTHGVSLYSNNQWTLYNIKNSKLPDNIVYSLASDSNGTVWIGTANGLVKANSSGWTVYNNENSGLSCDLILALAVDEIGNIWVGTNKGAFYFNGQKWENFTVENSDLPDNRVQTIIARNNKIYFGTSYGLAIYEY